MASSRCRLSCVIILAAASLTRADDDKRPLPPAVAAALQATVEGQRSGDLARYAATLASPLGPTFRIHADSAIKVGEAKRLLTQVLTEKFGVDPETYEPFAYAFDDLQLRATLARLVDIHLDDYGPSGDQFKLAVTTTVRTPDGNTRSFPQGFLAIEQNGVWKVEDLSQVPKIALLKKGAETNWNLFRAFTALAEEVKAGKYTSRQDALAAAKATYDRVTNVNAPPPPGHEIYVKAVAIMHTGDFAAALPLFIEAGNLGHSNAQCQVGLQYAEGLGTTVDGNKAVEWYRKAIAQNNPIAENHLGSMLLEGDGVPQNTAEGLRLLKLSADQDYGPAYLNIGRAYLFGFGVPQNASEGVVWYTKAAELGNDQAAYFAKWLVQTAGNQSFKSPLQVDAYHQIQSLRGAALGVEAGGRDLNGRTHLPDPEAAARLRAEADRLARENGLP